MCPLGLSLSPYTGDKCSLMPLTTATVTGGGGVGAMLGAAPASSPCGLVLTLVQTHQAGAIVLSLVEVVTATTLLITGTEAQLKQT